LIKHFSLLIVFVFTALNIFPVTLMLAPLDFHDADSKTTSQSVRQSAELVSILKIKQEWHNIKFQALPKNFQAPKSFFEVLELINRLDTDYLLYGFIEKKGAFLYAELKLFDRETRSIKKIFYAGDDDQNEYRLLNDLGIKLGAYIDEIYGTGTTEYGKEQAEGLVSLSAGPGWWFPLSRSWNEKLAPLGSSSLHIGFIPLRRTDIYGRPLLYFRTGFDLDYKLASSRPGAEQFVLHNFSMGLPLGVVYEAASRHSFYLSIIPQYCIEYLKLEALNSGTLESTAFSAAAKVQLDYLFKLNPSFSAVFSNKLAAAFIEPLRPAWESGLAVEYHFKAKAVKESD
jgi:hypothetical protein